MVMVSGYIYTINVENISELPHEKRYHAAIRHPTSWMEATFGYKVIKLSGNVTWHEGWSPDDLKEVIAYKGDYLVQAPMQPPRIIKTWDELRNEFKVFRNTKGGE